MDYGGHEQVNPTTLLSSLLLQCLECTQVLVLQLRQCRHLLWMEVILQDGYLLCCRNFSLCLRYNLAMFQVHAS